MAREKSVVHARESVAQPIIRRIDMGDLRDALRKGYADFLANPSHLMMLAVIYPIVGLMLARFTFGYDILFLLFPIIAGFALIGPLAAVGLYEMSRLRERGEEVGWSHALSVFDSHSIGSILALGTLQMLVYLVWLGTALAIYGMIFGDKVPESFLPFIYEVFTTAAGWQLIIVGCGVGFLFAVLVLMFSAVSFPMLVDRDISAADAAVISIRAFLANPMTMVVWGFVVSALLVIGMIPVFVGLAVIMPVLGHATWHLYRRLVQF